MMKERKLFIVISGILLLIFLFCLLFFFIENENQESEQEYVGIQIPTVRNG